MLHFPLIIAAVPILYTAHFFHTHLQYYIRLSRNTRKLKNF